MAFEVVVVVVMLVLVVLTLVGFYFLPPRGFRSRRGRHTAGRARRGRGDAGGF